MGDEVPAVPPQPGNPEWVTVTFCTPPRHFRRFRKSAIKGCWSVDGHTFILVDGLGPIEICESLDYIELMLDVNKV